MLQFFANVRLSESQSDLVNYIEMFEKLFSLVEKQMSKNRYHARHHNYIITYYFRSQTKLNFTTHIK